MHLGHILFYDSAMGGGKSTAAISDAQKYKSFGFETLVFVAKLQEDPEPRIASRLRPNGYNNDQQGIYEDAIAISDIDEANKIIKEKYLEIEADCIENRLPFEPNRRMAVIYDELQFIAGPVYPFIQFCKKKGINQVIAALLFNYRGDPFKIPESDHSIADVMALADDIIRLPARCEHTYPDGTKCGLPSRMTQRTRKTGTTDWSHQNDIEYDSDKEKYFQTCVKCHQVPGRFDQFNW